VIRGSFRGEAMNPIFFEWLLLGVALPVFLVYAMLRASR
jgi:hypothetical protein